MVIELVVIILPLLLHAIYGLWVVYLARNNVLRYTYYRNWMFYLQRITAIVTLIFVVWHVYSLRVANLLYGTEVSFDALSQILASPLYLGLYVIGLLAAVYHFANGLWTFLISWGITIGPRSQQTAYYCCAGLFILLSAIGLRSLLAF